MKYFALAAAISTLVFSSCSNDRRVENPAPVDTVGSMKIEVSLTADGKPAVAGKWFKAGNQDSIRYRDFAVYISNLKLINSVTGAVWVEKDSYHFIDAGEGNSQTITLPKVKSGTYDKVEFSFGIDSVANHSIAWVGKGDLAVDNGMSWDWNSGYKFMLFEGDYRKGSGVGPIVFHVGDNKNYKVINIPFTGIGSGKLNINGDKQAKMGLECELNAIITGPNNLDLAESNIVMFDPVITRKVTENIQANMFAVTSVE